ncbi:hypothetical protein ACFQZQ_11015 [Lysobacter koreensis]|uniref:Uncharacterized protein n=1 Tax=Lysobacter koreensis TaxID=266122 RepID=A0ABW2YN40_9GAMM
MDKVHVLKTPLYIGSETYPSPYMIPAGTTLYYDGSLSEGTSRYRIYINVKPGLNEESNVDGSIAPISADPVSKDDILEFVKGVRFSAEEVMEILRNGNFSAAERAEIERYLKATREQK